MVIIPPVLISIKSGRFSTGREYASKMAAIKAKPPKIATGMVFMHYSGGK